MSDQVLLSERQLRERVIELVQHAQVQISGSSSDIDIVQHFGLQINEDDLPIDQDGAYIESESKIIININITSSERRQFTLYHELVHHLIRNDSNLYSYLHDAYRETKQFDKTIEIICNVGAAEFILPRDSVRELIVNKGFSVELVPQLCKTQNVSGPAALIQLVQCAPNHCYGVVCEYGFPPSSGDVNQQTFIRPTQVKTLYILYVIWSPSARYSISRFTSIPTDHLLMQALSEEQLIKGKDRIPFRSGKEWRVPCQALLFRNQVYGIFNVTQPPNNQQLKLF